MNMVIHDLRNPCSQIKFSILFAMQKLDTISSISNGLALDFQKMGKLQDTFIST